MPDIYLVKFRQPPYSGVAAHWAIFVAKQNTAYDDRGLPIWGNLFHASKKKSNCLNLKLRNTEFDHVEEFHLLGSPGLWTWLLLENTNVTPADVNLACHSVSLNREFNLFTRNCQDWVKEVLKSLVESEQIPEAVFETMELHDFKTLQEICPACSSSSNSICSICCKCGQ